MCGGGGGVNGPNYKLYVFKIYGNSIGLMLPLLQLSLLKKLLINNLNLNLKNEAFIYTSTESKYFYDMLVLETVM